ncbi:MAG: glycosyltransferase [Planctomycetales bacterium]|nr:glycosyltransferase [Planctomycetales bacterium]MBN8628069.1 glycosyltransferase [Planctomycetota bacterium]
MDLSADQLLRHWPKDNANLAAVEVASSYRRLATYFPVAGTSRTARNLDRARNRYRLLPAYLRAVCRDFDLFHIVDHSYAHLVHELPAGQTGVYCHDVDAFRCLLAPQTEHRSLIFRRITRWIYEGLSRAAIVFHSTKTMGRVLAENCAIPAGRLCHVPLGVDEVFFSEDRSEGTSISDRLPVRPFVLHVGSCIPRKRIDVLLNVFAKLVSSLPELRLVKIGDAWTPVQRRQIADLRLHDFVMHLGKVDRSALIEAYRRAAITLVPSDAEGFGLPVVEALACGGAVLASDLPTLREAGGNVAKYAAVADIEAWLAGATDVMTNNSSEAVVKERKDWARQFSWALHARSIADAYSRISQTS